MATKAELELKVQSKDVAVAAKRNDELAESGDRVAKSSKAAAAAEDKQAQASARVAKTGKVAADSNRAQTATAARLQKQYSALQKTILATAAAFLSFQTAREAIRIIADFGEATAIVRALGKAAGATSEDLAALSKQARELGASTRFTATQATQAQAALIRGGLDLREALQAAQSTLDLAIGGMLSLDRAAEVTAITLNQFNLAASQSGRVADVLVKASSTSATTVEQLAEALKFAAPVAAGLGATFEETAAAMQVLANAGLQASVAGTNLRGAYATLAKPTERAAQQIQILAKASGQSVEAFDITKRSLGEVFQAFQDAGAGPKELLQIFGRLQAPGALALTRAGKEIDKFARDLEDAEGTAASFREELQKELKDQLLTLGSAVQELVLVFNDQYGPALISAVKFTTDVVNAISAGDEELKKFSAAARAAAKAVKFLAVAAGVFAAAKLAASIGAAAQAMIVFIRTLKVLRATLVSTGIGALIVGLGLLAAFALDASGAFDSLDESVGASTDQLKELAAVEKAAEQSQRQLANTQRIEDERRLAAAEMELAKEKELEDQRKKAGKAAAQRAAARRREAATAQRQLEFQDVEITERIDIAGLDRASAEIRKAQTEFEKLFAISKQLELRPGEGFFEGVARQVKDANKQIALQIEFADELAQRTKRLVDAQQAEEQARQLDKAFEASIRVGEALQSAQDDLAAFNQEGLRLTVADAMREFRSELEAIEAAAPELLPGIRAELQAIAESRFLLTLRENLAEVNSEMSQLAASTDRTDASFEQFAAAADAAIANYRRQLELAGADTRGLNAAIELTKREVMDFGKEVARAEGLKQLEDGITIITRSFFDLFETLITGSEDAGVAFANFIKSVTQALFQKFVVEQVIGAIGAAFGGIASANGNAFQSGNVIPFANGGVVGGPTVFPLGLAGEAGPEAIMPLQRGPDGRLGVIAQDGGRDRPGANPFVLRSVSPGASDAPTTQEVQRGVNRTTNVQFNVQTQDATSFKRSARQISDLALQSVRV